jgi:hypothetical protein
MEGLCNAMFSIYHFFVQINVLHFVKLPYHHCLTNRLEVSIPLRSQNIDSFRGSRIYLN